MIRIVTAAHAGMPRWSAADRSFTVQGELEVLLEDGRLAYRVRPVTPYVKTYDANDDSDDDDAAAANVCVALVDGAPAGEIRLSRAWNGYARIDDLVTGAAFRRQGVGAALVRHAIAWAQAQGLAGVTLETQNNNVAACALYEACGFRLGGFDAHLYRALAPGTREVALYWYWLQP